MGIRRYFTYILTVS